MKNKQNAVFGLIFLLVFLFVVSSCSRLQIFPNETSDTVQQTIAYLSTQFTPEAPLETSTPISSPNPTFTVTATRTLSPSPVICDSDQGKIEFREIIIPDSNHPLAFRVYLPPCYQTDLQIRYPVLYLLHGQTYTDDQWDRLGVDEIADELISTGQIPPFLIVMPWESQSLEDDKTSKFGQQLIDELIPWVDEEYRTCDLQECRAIGGISRGAAWAMRLGLINWELFGSIGAHSFAPFPGDFYNAPFWFQDIKPGKFPRIYMDMGSLDFMLGPAGLFEERLTKYMVAHEWIINTGTHNEDYWSSHVEDYIYWYTFPWKKLYRGSEAGYQTPTPSPTE